MLERVKGIEPSGLFIGWFGRQFAEFRLKTAETLTIQHHSLHNSQNPRHNLQVFTTPLISLPRHHYVFMHTQAKKNANDDQIARCPEQDCEE
jgi:hypothetical protein